ncbi:hypothetical protein H0A36_13070 [Endozoicomonas sp. SM1973]|uniref:Uncharacterized protein n=1 Tax=Spartinivicinus marinus TaxID=2994442 RepID=A0A853IH94_9GAMM|nr:hypothetical protein [Spartinivicinus marinus]MCX4029673.1 hypothetical protein [Spartinivicinus marinus]NYZ66946.1 hypothetical protein [Spartinivicinus marinus]
MNAELIDQYLEAVCPKCQSVIKKKIYAIIGCQTCGYTGKAVPVITASMAEAINISTPSHLPNTK